MPLGMLVAGFVGDRVRAGLADKAKKAVGEKVRGEVREALARTKAGRGLGRRLGRALDDIGTKVRRARLALSDVASESSAGEHGRRHSHAGHDVARLEDLTDLCDHWEDLETQSERSASEGPGESGEVPSTQRSTRGLSESEL